MTSIRFAPLTETHFSLLLQWLNRPHIKRWWDPDIQWTPALIKQKYASYAHRFKMQDNIKKPIYPFIIYENEIPVGFIQIYNAYDFPRSKPLAELPSQLAALDIFIGEESALHKGLGTRAIMQFLEHDIGDSYTHVLVDPTSDNIAAIRTYGHAGFKLIRVLNDVNEQWMLRVLHSN